MDAFSDLALDVSALEQVRDRMAAAIRAGLAADGQSVAALPAFLPPPPPDLRGPVLVVDLGGTNLRAAIVEVSGPKQAQVLAGPLSQKVELHSEPPISSARFFELQAELASQLSGPRDLALAYCFSYPSRVLPSRDARLLRWTKGIRIPGVVDNLVGAGLTAALSRAGWTIRSCTVLNDTVASLLAASLVFDGPPDRCVGLIVGTGSNMACFVRRALAPKLAGLPGTAPISINLESGNLDPGVPCALDAELDRRSTHPGEQRFEKAVGGRYLPQLFALAFPEHPVARDARGAGALAELAAAGANDGPTRLARALLDRSADLVAAGLAAVISLDPGQEPVGILAEGGTFWRIPGYQARVTTTLEQLAPPGSRFQILRCEEANLLGAALAARMS